MKWLDKFKGNGSASAEQLIKDTLNEHDVRFTEAIVPPSKVLEVRLEKGTIEGEGTYRLTVSSTFSRRNIEAVGIAKSEFKARRDGDHIQYEIPQKRLEEALTATYGVEFPERGAKR